MTLLVAELRVGAEDPEARRDELRRARASAAATIEAHGGTLGEPGDDRVLGIFGVPTAHEDDALRAARAACDLREADLLGRAAVATGAVITGDPGRGRPLVSGPPLQEADRLLASAAERDVLVGERTWRLVRHAVVRGASPRSVERVLAGCRGSRTAARDTARRSRRRARRAVRRLPARGDESACATRDRPRLARRREDAARARVRRRPLRVRDLCDRPDALRGRLDVRAASRCVFDARPGKRRAVGGVGSRRRARRRRRRRASRRRRGRGVVLRAGRGDGLGGTPPARDARPREAGRSRHRGRPRRVVGAARPRRARRDARTGADPPGRPRPARAPGQSSGLGRRRARRIDPARRPSFGARRRPARQPGGGEPARSRETGGDPRRGGGQPALPRAAPGRLRRRTTSFRTRSTRSSLHASTAWATWTDAFCRRPRSSA